MSGGDLVARVLESHGVRFLFTLCGGHISPILVGAKRCGIRVVDVRNEATAVFAADAIARLSGVPGVAAVTAGPGVTNSITALKNARLAQSPVVLLGGAAPTALKGRGALQDIDQLALTSPHVKWATSVRRVRDLVPQLENAFRIARQGVPGPVFVECPVDLLYDESVVRMWYGTGAESPFRRWYLDRHLNRIFGGAQPGSLSTPVVPDPTAPAAQLVRRAARALERAERPVLLVGSQALLHPNPREAACALADAVTRLGIPVYLSGMARGLLGREHRCLFRHARKRALGEADLVILAGVPCDFRLDYGKHINRDATLISANRSATELRKNRRPTLGIWADPASFIMRLAARAPSDGSVRRGWSGRLRAREEEREREIATVSHQPTEFVNPLFLLAAVDHMLDESSVLVLDGGDFAATASYVTLPRAPLASLDPGVFGTLGVGAGFALAAKLARPDADVWIIYGDGSAAYSLQEFDTYVRHGLPVIALVGNDAAWTQIARGQKEILDDDVGTVLRRTDYHRVAEGYGGKGFRIGRADQIEPTLRQAQETARSGVPVLVNAMIGTTNFRKGSISI